MSVVKSVSPLKVFNVAVKQNGKWVKNFLLTSLQLLSFFFFFFLAETGAKSSFYLKEY